MANFHSEDLRITSEEISSISGYIRYTHGKNENNETAYPSNEGVSFSFCLPISVGARCVELFILDEYTDKILMSQIIPLNARKGSYEEYKVRIHRGKLDVGIYFFYIKINGLEELYGLNSAGNVYFSRSLSKDNLFQFSIYESKYNTPTDRQGGIIYHLFVDRFYRKKTIKHREDAIYVDSWDQEIPEYPAYPGAFIKNNYFYGGNLYGVIEKLDYIASLGVNTIYLSPIFEAYSNHKYDTSDYMTVDAGFGGNEAFEKLIKEAKKRKIGIILDGVFNHTGAESIYFNKTGKYDSVGAYQSTNSPYYDWYSFEKHPNKYTCWWGIDILPRINPGNDSCMNYFVGEGGVIEKYAKMGVSGFRLDVADELSDSFIAKIKEVLNRYNDKSILYGEVWEDASNKIAYDVRKHYYLGNELDGVMNYPLRTGLINYIRDHDTSALYYALNTVMPNMPKQIRDSAMNLLGTHDTERILTTLGGKSSAGYTNSELMNIRMSKEEREVAEAKLMSAYTVLATLPGIPTIYYGDEAGMEGYSDPFNRRTYPWGNESKKLLKHYKKIGKIRRDNPVYKDGDFKLLYLTNETLIFERVNKNERFITVFNNSCKNISIRFKRKVTDVISNISSNTFEIKSNSASIFVSSSVNEIQL